MINSVVGMPPKPLIWAPPLALALSLSGCGGGGGPTSPGTAPTPSVPTYSVMATVFYDQNHNGQLDAGENTRVPGVDVVIGPGTGKSAPGTGQAVVSGVTEGSQSVALRMDSLPAYFQPESQLSVQVPAAGEVRIPVTLPIGDNHANLYLGFGDSITYGDGSSDRQGYVLKLQNLLGPYFGRAEVRAWGRPGTVERRGRAQDDGDAALVRPGLRADPLRHQRLARPAVPGQAGVELLHDRGAARHDRRHQGLGQPARARDDPAREPREGARGPQPLVRRHERPDQGARAAASRCCSAT